MSASTSKRSLLASDILLPSGPECASSGRSVTPPAGADKSRSGLAVPLAGFVNFQFA